MWVEKLKSKPVLPFSGRMRIEASSSSTSHSTLSSTLGIKRCCNCDYNWKEIVSIIMTITVH
jgi:hypothetical protein